MDILLQILFYLICFISVILCTNIYATLFNSSSNEQIFKAKSKQQTEPAEESLSDSKLISPGKLPICESLCVLEIDHSVN